jgi:hypothetical protein
MTTEEKTTPETVMNERCATCAFRANTIASNNPYTVITRNLCVMIGSQFLCHDAGEGHLCRGFVDAFTAKLANGDYNRLPEWKKQIAIEVLELLGDMDETLGKGGTLDESALRAKLDISIRGILDEAAMDMEGL